MTISQYTFLFSFQGKCYTYNSLSNSLLEIEQSDYDILLKAKQDNEMIGDSDMDKELFDTLVKHHHLSDNKKDEFLIYKSAINAVREQKGYMHLTIAPTTDCNFRCFYCFERQKRSEYMGESVMDSIVEYIKKIPSLKKIKITWFGGEPLMAKGQIKTLYHKLASLSGIKILPADIITTGYYIDEDAIDLFREANIDSAQITLDGKRESHNNVKKDSSCPDVFSRVIQNTKLLIDSIPDFHVTFRVNLTKNNIDEYVELFDYLMTEFKGKNIGIAPAFVSDRSPAHTKINKRSNVFLNREESGNFILDLVTKHGIHSPFIQYPDTQICECAIRDKVSISFDPQGYMYKCWEKIGDRKYAVGRVSENGDVNDVNTVELNRELYGADPLESSQCRDCEYLPICHGGCPIMRIQNEFENYNNDVCTIKKGKLEKFLKVHILLKERGYNNK